MQTTRLIVRLSMGLFLVLSICNFCKTEFVALNENHLQMISSFFTTIEDQQYSINDDVHNRVLGAIYASYSHYILFDKLEPQYDEALFYSSLSSVASNPLGLEIQAFLIEHFLYYNLSEVISKVKSELQNTKFAQLKLPIYNLLEVDSLENYIKLSKSISFTNLKISSLRDSSNASLILANKIFYEHLECENSYNYIYSKIVQILEETKIDHVESKAYNLNIRIQLKNNPNKNDYISNYEKIMEIFHEIEIGRQKDFSNNINAADYYYGSGDYKKAFTYINKNSRNHFPLKLMICGIYDQEYFILPVLKEPQLITIKHSFFYSF